MLSGKTTASRLSAYISWIIIVTNVSMTTSRSHAEDQARDFPVSLDIDSSTQVIGKASAPIVVIEFMDYQCPYCFKFHSATFPLLKRNFIDRGLVKIVVKDLPLISIPLHTPQALAMKCAEQQGRFWQMYNTFLTHPRQINDGGFERLELLKGVNLNTLKECVAKDAYEVEFTRDANQAKSVGIEGVPSFVIGRKENGVIKGLVLPGAYSYAAFEDIITKAIRTKTYLKLPSNDRAIVDADVSLLLNPKSANAYSDRGRALLGKRDFNSALIAFNKLISLQPKNGEAYLYRARAYEGHGDLAKVEADLNTCLRLDPNNWLALSDRGRLAHNKGLFDQALGDYQASLSIHQSPTTLYNMSAIYLDRSDYKSAVLYMDQAIDLDYNDVNLYARRAKA